MSNNGSNTCLSYMFQICCKGFFFIAFCNLFKEIININTCNFTYIMGNNFKIVIIIFSIASGLLTYHIIDLKMYLQTFINVKFQRWKSNRYK